MKAKIFTLENELDRLKVESTEKDQLKIQVMLTKLEGILHAWVWKGILSLSVEVDISRVRAVNK